jgi:hypothetical protein
MTNIVMQKGRQVRAVRLSTYSLQVFLTSTHLGIAMEFAPGGDLHKYLQSL